MEKMSKIYDKVREFCEKTPQRGFESEYLETAGNIYQKYIRAKYVFDNEESPEELEKLYREIEDMV